MQSRWRSKGAWLSTTALTLFLLKNYGLLTVLGLTAESYNELTTLIFTALAAFGFWNNPENKDGF